MSNFRLFQENAKLRALWAAKQTALSLLCPSLGLESAPAKGEALYLHVL